MQDLKNKIEMSRSNMPNRLQDSEALRSHPAAIAQADQRQIVTGNGIVNDLGVIRRHQFEGHTDGVHSKAVAGIEVTNPVALHEAKQNIGHMGEIGLGCGTLNVHRPRAENKSRQHVGHMSADVGKHFWA